MDVTNDQCVGGTSDGWITVAMPKTRMSKPEALRHAAWLVSVADPIGDVFAEVLAAVQST